MKIALAEMNRSKQVYILIAIVAIGIISIGLIKRSGSNTSQQNTGEIKVGNRVGNRAPDFATADFQGNPVKLSDFSGQAIFVNFWATWCPFCVDELPLMADIQAEVGDKYVTLAVDRAEKPDRAKAFSDNLGVTDRIRFVIDDSDHGYSLYGGFSMPFSVFIDQDGIIRDIKQGPLTRADLLKRLEKIISSPEAKL